LADADRAREPGRMTRIGLLSPSFFSGSVDVYRYTASKLD